MTTISGGQTPQVSSGQTSSGFVVESGGIFDVLSGGTATETALSGGSAVVFGGGDASLTTIYTGAIETLFGIAMWDTVSGGGHQFVSAGGLASGAVVQSGGNQVVFAGGYGGQHGCAERRCRIDHVRGK